MVKNNDKKKKKLSQSIEDNVIACAGVEKNKIRADWWEKRLIRVEKKGTVTRGETRIGSYS